MHLTLKGRERSQGIQNGWKMKPEHVRFVRSQLCARARARDSPITQSNCTTVLIIIIIIDFRSRSDPRAVSRANIIHATFHKSPVKKSTLAKWLAPWFISLSLSLSTAERSEPSRGRGNFYPVYNPLRPNDYSLPPRTGGRPRKQSMQLTVAARATRKTSQRARARAR